MLPLRFAAALLPILALAPPATGAADPDIPPPLALPLNAAVTQATIASTICAVGWTKTVRPPYSVTNRIKLEKLRAAGLTEADKPRFELDHLIPLALGGATDDPNNLALEPWSEASQKDKVEACLAAMVCAGRVTLDEARQAIWEDWRAAGQLCK